MQAGGGACSFSRVCTAARGVVVVVDPASSTGASLGGRWFSGVGGQCKLAAEAERVLIFYSVRLVVAVVYHVYITRAY